MVQVVDANVFSYMQDFEVNDDLSMRVSPTVITPNNEYASLMGHNALGVKIGLTF